MSESVRISCDGRRCPESTIPRLVEREGWTRTNGVDLCRRCSTGKCAGTVGRRPGWMSPDQFDPCPCLLPAGHYGTCQCSHNLSTSVNTESPT